ncbi:hypothetical protein CSB37_04250 [bacterium DOLZORAL124_38_8]|nr:MAG: hypothetical protein CSB37_04250 [bacterium DOLZORAL124_38_8]
MIELLVVIVIVGILAGMGIAQYKVYMARARDAVRVSDMQTIYKALLLRQTEKGCVPHVGDYHGHNAGAWDYSSQGNSFMPFLKTEGYLDKVPVDPINNMEGDMTSGQYAYKYYCYPTAGVRLGYRRESDGREIYFHNQLGDSSYEPDNRFTCCP